MQYCLVNKIKTPDGTVLCCEHSHDYKTHEDATSGEVYMTDGKGYCVRRSCNIVPYEDLSVWVDADNPELTPEVRNAEFWGTYGVDGNQPRKQISLAQMQDSHLRAIIQTQRHIQGSVVEKLMKLECEYRNLKFEEHSNEK